MEMSGLCSVNITDHFEFDAFRERYVDARETIHAFYNDLSVEEETPNTLQYEDRHDQSRADNDK
jgi:hypothetical protein